MKLKQILNKIVIKKYSKVERYTFFDKKTRLGESVNEELAQELHKPVVKKIKQKKSVCQV